MQSPCSSSQVFWRIRTARRSALFLTALLLPMFTGCTSMKEWLDNGYKVGPNYCPPSANVACDWIDTGNRHLVGCGPGPIRWWEAFGDPTLDRLVVAAAQQNLSLRIAGFRILDTREPTRICRCEFFF